MFEEADDMIEGWFSSEGDACTARWQLLASTPCSTAAACHSSNIHTSCSVTQRFLHLRLRLPDNYTLHDPPFDTVLRLRQDPSAEPWILNIPTSKEAH